jgi:hypothetical protein
VLTDVRIAESMSDVDRSEWMSVIRAADAPAFYDCLFLDAYERVPLQPTEAFFYLLFGTPAVAVVPAYLQRTDDAAGDISGLPLPGHRPGDRILISHVTHCYDTTLPARAAEVGLTELAGTTLARIGHECGAKWVAFLDVPAGGRLAGDLTTIGWDRHPMETRYRADITGCTGSGDFIAAMPRQRRHRMRTNQRRALALGATATVQVPGTPAADITAAVELCRDTTARHGTPDYYPGEFGKFVELAGALVQVTEVRIGGRPATAAISLVDRSRYHMWAGGLDYDVLPPTVSGFELMLGAGLDAAAGCGGLRTLEAGRGNTAVKQRYRLEPVPLLAFVTAC